MVLCGWGISTTAYTSAAKKPQNVSVQRTHHKNKEAGQDTPGTQGGQPVASDGYGGHAAPHDWQLPENPPLRIHTVHFRVLLLQKRSCSGLYSLWVPVRCLG